MSLPVVAIVGRPNVGKSTMFNRLIQKRVAIEESTPGVTRDRIYGRVEWTGSEFWLIDTGGLTFEEDKISQEIHRQVKLALDEANLLIFLVDVRSGPVFLDFEIAAMLRKNEKPVILVANKAESANLDASIAEFYALGLGEPYPTSAAHGLGTGDLLDEIKKHLPPGEVQEGKEDLLRVAIIGRPNVGKSSLVNKISGTERVIVTDIPGTTRDSIDLLIEQNGRCYLFVDTAGIRRKSKVEEAVEYYSVLRSIRAAESADVVLMLLDAAEEISEQDKRIAGIAHEAGRAMILVVNKWDKVEKDEKTMDAFRENIRKELAYLAYAPIVFISALTGQRVQRLYELIDYVAEQHAMRVKTSRLNELLEDATAVVPPPTKKGKQLKIYYLTQIRVKPPTFAVIVNDPELAHFSYVRFLENKLREAYGFEGTPIRIVVRKKTKKEDA
ncbi:MAG: ribosome biogenesis GTPase Der [Dethiobacter sp.]|nr:ribosome biogenesis GTPase Der [Dethiobacter sp.]MBS3900333.1 ribosome biogenesis GTPase Der [Dethiobacter sp.]MBS3983167.1 ribosome biogenesis GTPase Der [Dethiobacter sp.]MCL4462630.1 ribosome biogenesis GTPase Der [Bacillota bacterium]MCL5994025.1 ribosome biogenesis GTPase Der [Bacillota bacterium]